LAEVGSGAFTYDVEPGWGSLPADISLGWIAAVAVDGNDHVYVYSRSDLPMIVLDRGGTFIAAWGLEFLEDAHGLFIDTEQTLWCTERETHCVRRCSTDGQLLMTIGTPHTAGGVGEPFHLPTDLAVDSQGCLFITDGYGNARVHKYSPEGEHILSWGEPGTGPGQFDLPHCVRIDSDDRVLVADRSNNRIQIFDTDGHYQQQWGGFRQPDTIHIDNDGVIYVAELEQRVSILDHDGQILTQWGRGERIDEPGEFLGCPHGIWTDSHGDLYVSEVQTDGRLQKFVRRQQTQRQETIT
jgi:sugar lactone lactonase YvrE